MSISITDLGDLREGWPARWYRSFNETVGRPAEYLGVTIQDAFWGQLAAYLIWALVLLHPLLTQLYVGAFIPDRYAALSSTQVGAFVLSPVMSAAGLVLLYLLAICINRAWVADEQRREGIANAAEGGSADDKPDLRLIALLSGIPLIVVMPMMLWSINTATCYFEMCIYKGNGSFLEWIQYTYWFYLGSALSFGDGIARLFGLESFNFWPESSITAASFFAYALNLIVRPTLEIVAVASVIRFFRLQRISMNAVLTLKHTPYNAIKVGSRIYPYLFQVMASGDGAQEDSPGTAAQGSNLDSAAVNNAITAMGYIGGETAFNRLIGIVRKKDERARQRSRAIKAAAILVKMTADDGNQRFLLILKKILADIAGSNEERPLVRGTAESELSNLQEPPPGQPMPDGVGPAPGRAPNRSVSPIPIMLLVGAVSGVFGILGSITLWPATPAQAPEGAQIDAPASAVDDGELRNLRAEIDRLKGLLAALESGKGEWSGERHRLQARIDELTEQIGRQSTLSRGLDQPPCWEGSLGRATRPDYLFDVAISDEGITVEKAFPPSRAREYEQLPTSAVVLGAPMTAEQFLTAMRPITSSASGCRHFVRLFDGGHVSLEAYKEQRSAIESIFFIYRMPQAASRGAPAS